MEQKDIDGILSKIEHLRSIFIITESIFPFIEDLLIFVKEIRPLLISLTSSIEDSTKKNVKASAQLDKVTEATEMATTEILDKLDHLLPELDVCQDSCKSIKDLSEKDQEVMSDITDFAESSKDEIGKLPKGKEFLKAVASLNSKSETVAIADKIEQSLEQIRFDGYDIMNALQVQDITSQQLASANVLLESVKNKMAELVAKFTQQEYVAEKTKRIAHDADADFLHRENRQDLADEIASQISKKTK